MSPYVAPARLLAAIRELPGDRWTAETSPDGTLAVAMRTTGTVTWLRLLHDGLPAPQVDVEFVAGARGDVETLLRCLQDDVAIDEAHLVRMRERFEAATPGEWVFYLESDGGLGGSNVITMAGSEADLYLVTEGVLAPDPVWVFAGLAHREIPAMVAAVTAGGGPE